MGGPLHQRQRYWAVVDCNWGEGVDGGAGSDGGDGSDRSDNGDKGDKDDNGDKGLQRRRSK